ncbi:MAG: formate dehydrogenase accessory sulfurtransferase FdhD [Nevskia sp.]|nr:formate dehydrogenase accessory sulfurtransferase FdhD [Nevskia sp.]
MPSPPSKPAAAHAAAGSLRLPAQAWRGGRMQRLQECVAQETPVALVYNGEPHAVMMATPCDLEDFAVGFSLTEEVVAAAAEIEALEVRPLTDDSGGVEVRLRIPAARLRLLQHRRRNLAGRTGCGLCGAQTIAEAVRQPRRVPAGAPVSAAALRRALEEVRRGQALNAATGAMHAAAWATADGAVRCLREDVGRHNALDKLAGALLRSGQDPAGGFAVVTSRASYEMALKAAMAGIPLLAAISAPTARAVAVAEEAGLTLLGFARGDSFVVYACAARLAEAAPRAAAPAGLGIA